MAAPLSILLKLDGMESVQAGFNSVASSMQKMSDKMVSVGKTMSLAVTVPLTAFAVIGIKELSSVQAAMAQTGAAIKSTGGAAGISAEGVRKLAESLQQKSAVDAEVIQSGANLLLMFTNIRNVAGENNDVFNRATKISLDLSRSLGKDLSSASIMVGKALNDPVKGLTALGKAGVQFTDTQQKMIKSLVDSGKTMEAQKIILAALEIKVGGSAEAYSKTLGGALDTAKLSVEDLAGSLMEALAPAITGILSVALRWINWFNTLDESTKSIIATIGVLVAAVGPLLIMFGKVTSAIKVLDITMSGVMKFSPYIVAIGLLITAGILLYQNWDKVAAIAKVVWNNVKLTVLSAVEIMLDALEHFTGWIPWWGTQISAAAGYIREMRLSVEKDMRDIVKPMTDVTTATVKTNDALNKLGAEAPGAIAAITEKEKQLEESLGRAIVNIQQTGADVGDLIDQYIRAGKSIKETDALVSHINSTWRDSQESLGKNIVAAQDVFNSNTKLIAQLYALQKELTQAGFDVTSLTKHLEQEKDVTKDLENRIKLLKDVKDNMRRSVEDLNESYGEMIKQYIDAGVNITNIIELLGINKLSIEDTALALTLLEKHWDKNKQGIKEVTIVHNQFENSVKRLADSVKMIWNKTSLSLKDVWHKMLDDFTDVLSNMLVEYVKNQDAIKKATTTGMKGTSPSGGAVQGGVAGAQSGGWAGAIIGAFAGFMVATINQQAAGEQRRKEERKQLESIFNSLPKSLEKIFAEFTSNFRNALGSFKERLYSTFQDMTRAVNNLQSLTGIGQRATNIVPIIESISEAFRTGTTEGYNALTESQFGRPGVEKFNTEMGSYKDINYSGIKAEIQSIVDVLKSMGTGIETNKFTTSGGADKFSFLNAKADVINIITAIAKTFTDKSIEITDLLIQQFNKAKAIAESILSLLDAQKAFSDSIDDTIKDVQRSTMSQQDIFKAQLSDIDAIKSAVSAGKEKELSYLAEIEQANAAIRQAELDGNIQQIDKLKYALNLTQKE